MSTQGRWLFIGCKLIGYNYGALRSCSEIAARRVKRYASAMIIVMVLWAFIGFVFSERYIGLSWYSSLVGSVVAMLLIVQIERQVILAPRKAWLPFAFRTVIAFAMAIIGSMIIDQIIFKKDVESRRSIEIGKNVDEVAKTRTTELQRQMNNHIAAQTAKEQELNKLNEELARKPFVRKYNTTVVKQDTGQQSKSQKSATVTTTVNYVEVDNPKGRLANELQDQIDALTKERMKIDSLILGVHKTVEAELRQNSGFLEELKLAVNILKESTVALITYIIWLVLLFGLEMFIVVSKLFEEDNDYDVLLQHQVQIHKRRIELLSGL